MANALEASMPPVALVGAGPGDPDFLTLRARDLLDRAQVVVHDRLVSADILATLPVTAERIDVGKTPGGSRVGQGEIHRILINKARLGLRVVRLKGGDPFVFGRGSEELDALEAAGLEVEVVPGLSSAFTAPLAARIPVTERGRARNVAVLTVQTRRGVDLGPLRRVAQAETLVLMMGAAALGTICAELRQLGRPGSTPAAVVERATQGRQRIVRSTLDELPADLEAAGLRAPMTVVIGDVAAARHRSVPGPLDGRRLVLTSPRDRGHRLARRLRGLGAEVLHLPLTTVRLRSAVDGRGLEALRNLGRFKQVIFTSADAVSGFRRALSDRGLDARALGGVRLTATVDAVRALEKWGLRADEVLETRGGAVTVQEAPGHVLWPRGDGCPPVFPISRVGSEPRRSSIQELPVYDRVPVSPAAEEAARLVDGAGADGVVFDDPAAVAGFQAQRPSMGAAAFFCVGGDTLDAARRAGLSPAHAVDVGDGGDLDAPVVQALRRDLAPATHPAEENWTEALDALAV
ncbi:MAG: uroporphyrinogen-III C-methyltransferase [Acidobacteriota bacterium]